MAEQKMSGEGDKGEAESGEFYPTSIPFVCFAIPPERKVEYRRRQIHRVPLQLPLKNQQQYVYDSMMVSIGPYRHGKPHLRQMEEFKREALTVFLLSGNGCSDKR